MSSKCYSLYGRAREQEFPVPLFGCLEDLHYCLHGCFCSSCRIADTYHAAGIQSYWKTIGLLIIGELLPQNWPTHAHTHTHPSTPTPTHVHTHTHTHTHARTPSCTHTHTHHTHARAAERSPAHARSQSRTFPMQARTCARIHSLSLTHMHTSFPDVIGIGRVQKGGFWRFSQGRLGSSRKIV